MNLIRILVDVRNYLINSLDAKQKFSIYKLLIFQLITNILDLVGVLLVGYLLTLSINGIQSRQLDNRSQTIIDRFHLSSLSFQELVAVLGSIIVIVFLTKSILSVVLNRITFKKLSDILNKVSRDKLQKLFKLQSEKIAHFSHSKIQYDFSIGLNALFVEVPGFALLLIVDFALVTLLIVSLFIIDIFVAIFTITAFGLLGLILTKFFSTRSSAVGQLQTMASTNLNAKISNVLSVYQEIRLRGVSEIYVDEIQNFRLGLSNALWKSSYYPTIGKYIFESSTILFAVLLSAIEFFLKDAVSAISILTVFMATSSRIAPAILRIQQSISMLQMNYAKAELTRAFLEEIDKLDAERAEIYNTKSLIHESSLILFKGVSYQYADGTNPVFENLNLRIERGSYVALVGPSGSGKSSLVKLLINCDLPSIGTIEVFGFDPATYIENYPARIGYVPQNVKLIDGDIYQNIKMSPKISKVDIQKINGLLTKLELTSLIPPNDESVATVFKNQKEILSGGQIQRIGIARALFSNPEILILDEATSALDAQTESATRKVIENLKGNTTLIVIAHRLSTVMTADFIVYLKDGKIIGNAPFQELKRILPEFETQAQLLGL